jgi:iron complex transport system ATP-binding protein
MSLEVQNISVTRGGKPILADVSFTAPTGAVTGLLGPNGAGKSTLLHAILGLTPATGSARFANHALLTMNRRHRARLASLVEQSATTEERLTVHDVVSLGRIPFQPALGSAGSVEDDAIIAAALAETRMQEFAKRRFDTLSGGEQQRVQIARALAQQPQLLMLDEPTSHLDIRAQLGLTALLHRKAEAGMTVLFALHDLNLAARCCDHLVVLDKGRVAAEGTPAAVLTPELLLRVYGVAARLLPDPQSSRPVIVYDHADTLNPLIE